MQNVDREKQALLIRVYQKQLEAWAAVGSSRW